MSDKEKIAITGSKGTIGTVLARGLSNFNISGIDLPEIDVSNYDQLFAAVKNHSAIIHLAWDTKAENFLSETYLQKNTDMFMNVYRAAIEAGVPRVIMASSVEVSDWRNTTSEISASDVPSPVNLYGAHKIAMEAVGKVYSTKGLEVICIRFGGIAPNNIINSIVSLDHEDCTVLVKNILAADKIPNNYTIVQAVSDNVGRIHSTENPFGWRPHKR